MATQKSKDKATELRTQVCTRILELMEQDGLEWSRGFDPVSLQAQNPLTPTRYRGANRFALALLHEREGKTDPRWCTLRQANAKGWKVKKGSKAEHVVAWKPRAVAEKKTDDPLKPYRFLAKSEEKELLANGEKVHYIMILAGINSVFNFSDLENASGEEIPPYFPPTLGDADELIDSLIASSRCEVKEQLTSIHQCAYYKVLDDVICIPPRGAYRDAEQFISALIHEMAHSTKVPLGRPKTTNKEETAYEELLAELASVFVCADLGVKPSDGLEAHASYLKSWLKSCKKDPTIMEKAITDAQKIADYLMARLESVRDAEKAA